MEKYATDYKSGCNRSVPRTEHYSAAPKVVADLMVKNKVPPGIALQFVSNIKRFLREEEKS
jgi:hypothetical protein